MAYLCCIYTCRYVCTYTYFQGYNMGILRGACMLGVMYHTASTDF